MKLDEKQIQKIDNLIAKYSRRLRWLEPDVEKKLGEMEKKIQKIDAVHSGNYLEIKELMYKFRRYSYCLRSKVNSLNWEKERRYEIYKEIRDIVNEETPEIIRNITNDKMSLFLRRIKRLEAKVFTQEIQEEPEGDLTGDQTNARRQD